MIDLQGGIPIDLDRVGHKCLDAQKEYQISMIGRSFLFKFLLPFL